MSDNGGVSETREGGVLTITLSRERSRNALDRAMIVALIDALERATTDDSLRAVLIQGDGGHFCSGIDWVRSNSGDTRPRAGDLLRRVPLQANRIIELVTALPLPVIAKVRGYAVGFGLSLTLAADFAVVSDDAVLWAPFTERGFTPDSGSTWLLPRLIGLARAREVLLLGERLTGAEAGRLGVVHRAVPAATLDDEASALAERLAAGPTAALALGKRLLAGSAHGTLPDAMREELYALELAARTADFKEGLLAFSERRKPEFTGR